MLRCSTALGLIFAISPCTGALGDEPKLSISGYDPVAYFTDAQPVPGKPEFDYLWHKLHWRFASRDHLNLFTQDPSRYAPQYDGFCAAALGGIPDAVTAKQVVDPEAWAIVDGKLYLARNKYWLEKWREHVAANIQQADAGWPVVEKLPDPVIVGPPCAASPPTTIATLRGGGHWMSVAGQVARDDAGNTIGKGDLQAQIEQVGKNFDKCLAAGGASVKDVFATISYVNNPGEFDKYTDMRLRYFGPSPPPYSATVSAPQLAGTDYLVQVEGFAAIK
jgi:enamine deaminase RidA (YjgF/YER057c/UK114 family)